MTITEAAENFRQWDNVCFLEGKVSRFLEGKVSRPSLQAREGRMRAYQQWIEAVRRFRVGRQ